MHDRVRQASGKRVFAQEGVLQQDTDAYRLARLSSQELFFRSSGASSAAIGEAICAASCDAGRETNCAGSSGASCGQRAALCS